MSRTKTEKEADRRACWHAHLAARAMARDTRVSLIGHGHGLLAEGVITHKSADATHGLVLTCDGKRVPITAIAQMRRAA